VSNSEQDDDGKANLNATAATLQAKDHRPTIISAFASNHSRRGYRFAISSGDL